jgi:chemotaxis family two-component system response regulator Rcp1
MITTAEILLVDDNPADTDLISDVLGQSQRPCHVCAVHDGVEAIAFLHLEGQYAGALRPDLVVLDLNMPRKDGCSVLAEVKSDAALKRIPIVVFTSSVASHDIERSYELGANSYVGKPGNLADYVATVKSIAEFWIGLTTMPLLEEPWKIIAPTSC